MPSTSATSAIRHGALRTRRQILQVGAVGLGGLTLPNLLKLDEAGAASKVQRPSRARSVILLYLNGGPSQLDTWDMKPDAPAEIRGTFQPIATTVPGFWMSEHLPQTARLAHRFAVIRSMSHHESDHPKANY